MSKHAYLIIAHKNIAQLNFLISLLDDRRNDIYLHIDKKSIIQECDIINTHYSNRYFIERMSAFWGGESLVFIEFELIKSLKHYNYDYVHLLSGEDLPIKNQDYIHTFFEKNRGLQFVQLIDNQWSKQVAKKRLKYYYVLQEGMGSGLNRKNFVRKIIQRSLIIIQSIIGINRIKDINVDLVCGSQWFSITGDLAFFISKQEHTIEKHFHHTVCGDEVFIQYMTLLSPYNNDVYSEGNMRLLSFNKGTSHPITYSSEDKETLLRSDCLFARKFDIKQHPDSIELIRLLHSKSIQ